MEEEVTRCVSVEGIILEPTDRLLIVRQASRDSGIADYEDEFVSTLTLIVDTEDDMSEEEELSDLPIDK